MNTSMTLGFEFSNALIFTLKIALVPLLAFAVCGLFVAILQTATSVQEQASAFLLKILTGGVVIFVLSNWFSQEFLAFAQSHFFILS